MIATLERETCGPKNLLDESKKDLAKLCKKELNYPVLSQTIDRDKTKVKLEKCMEKIGLRPFKTETIEKYKKEEADRQWYKYNENEIKACAIIVGVAVLFFCTWFTGFRVVPCVLTVVGVLGLCLVLFGALPGIFGLNTDWESSLLSKYSSPIPEYALETALGLQKELKAEGIDSECSFYVESLFVKRIARDPFLLVRCGDNRYYLEVWDEPNFGAEKLV